MSYYFYVFLQASCPSHYHYHHHLHHHYQHLCNTATIYPHKSLSLPHAGIFFGFLETYMYRYLSGLGASPVLVGLTVTVGAPFEVVLTLLASYLVPLTGHAPIIVFGLFGHAVRLFGKLVEVNDRSTLYIFFFVNQLLLDC